MMVASAGPEAPGLNVSSKHRPVLADQAAGMTLDTILAGLDVLSTARARLRSSNHGRVLFEMALVRLARLENLVAVTQLAQAVSRGEIAAPEKQPSRPSASGAPDPSKKKLSGDGDANARGAAPLARPASTPVPLTAASLPSLWQQVLALQGPVLRNDLEKAGFPAISGPNTLVLRFPPGYNASRDRCQDPDKVARIEQLLQQLTGQKCNLRVESGSDRPDPASPARTAGDPEYSQSRLSPPREEAKEPPLVQWAKDRLGAKTVKVDPGFGAAAPASAERADPPEAEET